VEAGRGFATDLLQGEEVTALKEADRRLATELAMGVLRWRGELDFQIRKVSGRPVERLDAEVATILRLGIYQVQFLDRIPKAAVVNDAVEMTKAARKRSAAGFVNSVLRKCPAGGGRFAPGGFDSLDKARIESARRATPGWLLERWARNFSRPGADGELVASRLAWASTQISPTVVRVVRRAEDVARLREELAAEGIKTRPGRFSSLALVVEAGNVRASEAFRQCRVVIQDEASQLVAELLAPLAGQRVLDLCAAPGIKAGQIAQAMGSGTLVTCDRSATRLRTLVRLLPPWLPEEVRGLAVQLDASRPLPFGCSFERILLDAPCSGTGTLARNPEIKFRLQEADVKRLAETQVNLLRAALNTLALGGRLVYATCSLEPEENERAVERALENAPGCHLVRRTELESAHPSFSPFFDAQGHFRTRPDLHGMDGFFAAVLVRKN
jgi:16S rRNA (cytosine967-C5)-methyltransferase